jgi:hypothetical protein
MKRKASLPARKGRIAAREGPLVKPMPRAVERVPEVDALTVVITEELARHSARMKRRRA